MADDPTDPDSRDREFLAYSLIETAVYLWGVKIYFQRGDRLRAFGGMVLAGFNIFVLSRRIRRDE